MAVKFKGYPQFGAKNRPQMKNPSRSIQRKILGQISEKGITPKHRINLAFIIYQTAAKNSTGFVKSFSY